jgi:putative flippase GtrA
MLSGVIGTELSLLANFGLNDKWSFIGEKAHSFKDRIIMFHKISFGGIVIKMVALYIFTSVFGIYYILSSIMGLGMAYGWNMMMNRRHTWS